MILKEIPGIFYQVECQYYYQVEQVCKEKIHLSMSHQASLSVADKDESENFQLNNLEKAPPEQNVAAE